MKRTLLLVLALLLLCSLTACARLDTETSCAAEERATELVQQISRQNYSAILPYVRPDLSEQITAEVLANAIDPLLAKAGAFTGVRSVAAAASHDRASGEDYIVAVVIAQYETGKLRYTITFDQALSLVDLYVK